MPPTELGTATVPFCVSIIMAALVCRKMESSHLCLSSLALMVWHADFVKDTMQLVNAAVDLLGEVAGVHGEQNQPPQATQVLRKRFLPSKAWNA